MNEVWRRARSVLERPVGEDLQLVPVDAEGVADLTSRYRLEGPAARWLWERLSQPADVETLAAGLEERFEVDRAQARSDVQEFLRDLKANGFVEAGDP